MYKKTHFMSENSKSKTVVLSVFLSLILFAGCKTSSIQTDNDSYVFDNVASDTTFIASAETLAVNNTPVNVQIPEFGKGKISVQAGAFKSAEKARKLADILRNKYNKTTDVVQDAGQKLYLVRITAFRDMKSAREFVALLKKHSIEAFVVK